MTGFNGDKGENAADPKWDEEDLESDPNMRFCPAEVLEVLRNDFGKGGGPVDYFPRGDYLHLRRQPIDLETAELTDRQLMAVSLVFYAGARKNRAARAMNISPHAVTEHLNAALKKIR